MTLIEYVLWSTRNGGWYANGIYVSDLASATRFTSSDAIEMCKTHRGKGEVEFGLLPVELLFLEEISA